MPTNDDTALREQFNHLFKELEYLAQNETQLKMIRIAKQNADALIRTECRKARIDERLLMRDELSDTMHRHSKNRDLSPMAELKGINSERIGNIQAEQATEGESNERLV